METVCAAESLPVVCAKSLVPRASCKTNGSQLVPRVATSASLHVLYYLRDANSYLRESKALFKVAAYGDAAGAQTVTRIDDSGDT